MKLALLLAAAFFFEGTTPDPWATKDVMQPKTLADRLQANERPTIFYVGFPALYRNGPHIPGAPLVGPCSKPDGLALLKTAVAQLPHTQEIILYCGCCPFVRCPNIRPAYGTLHDLGFTNIKVVSIETNLHTDWIEKGYPVEKPAQ
jgi:thiosulfate/3-mercaptopyruvate sulfurtransferase